MTKEEIKTELSKYFNFDIYAHTELSEIEAGTLILNTCKKLDAEIEQLKKLLIEKDLIIKRYIDAEGEKCL